MAHKILKIGVTGFLMATIFVSRFICNKKGGANGLIDNNVGSEELNENSGCGCC